MENNRFSSNEQITNDIDHEKYHTVSLRSDLPRIPKYYEEESLHYASPNEFWMKKLDPLYTYGKNSSSKHDLSTLDNIQYSITNGPYTSTCNNHPILTAFLRAYNSHEDIILSPDDIWLMICIYFAKYVNNNMVKLRHLFINTQKNELLTVDNDQTTEMNWENFLQQIYFQMTNYVKNDLCQLLTNNFSTTTKVESLLSSLTIMSTFKKRFDYTYSINSCGIRHIHFMGNIDDWILLREKTSQLKFYTIENDDFFVYINGILPILDEFIQTYQGNVNNQFWDTIFDIKHTKDESNQSNGMYMNGWFLQLCYGNHMKQTCFMSCIELDSLIVPVQVENEHTNTSKTCYLIGGFHGVRSYNEQHKPVMSLVVIDDITTITNLEK
ncbi:unnamed protein product [Adineta steineri]|uniref:Uncharacterized protein n=1 Tax=Adineta steineri TaxID=433720 RepID=A0A815YPF8_9BILA|nr:unnamed protein product [Adineta steineri]